MPEGQRHLTHPGRCQIHSLMKSGLSGGAIARQLGRDRTTVWREVRRNPGKRACRHARAQRRAEARRCAASSVPSRMTPEPVALVEGRLAEGWSPERISGRLRKEGEPMAGRQWIYRHVHADRRAGGLWRHLRHRARRPNRRGGAHAGRGHIPGRVDIPERPAPGEGRERVGDREADTIVGAGTGGAVVSLVDRALRYTLLRRVGSRTAAAVGAAMTGLPGPHRAAVHTVTADSGREFADHARVAGAPGAGFPCARPCHSRERGPTGHTNGLVCPASRACPDPVTAPRRGPAGMPADRLRRPVAAVVRERPDGLPAAGDPPPGQAASREGGRPEVGDSRIHGAIPGNPGTAYESRTA